MIIKIRTNGLSAKIGLTPKFEVLLRHFEAEVVVVVDCVVGELWRLPVATVCQRYLRLYVLELRRLFCLDPH